MNFNEKFVNKEQVEFFHEQTVELLEKKGVYFDHKDALDIFKKHGFKVDGDVVFFNRKQIEDAIALCPQTFTWEAQDYSVTVDGSKKNLAGPCVGAPFVNDGINHVRRGLLKDYVDLSKIIDTSEVMDFTHTLLIDTDDVPTDALPYVQVANLLKYVNKPINMTSFETTSESIDTVAKKQIKMIKQFYGKESGVVLGGVCATSPMAYGKPDIDVLFAYLSEKQPVMLIACSLPVLTCHASIASTIIQNNAEILAGVVLTQLVEPETPVVYATISSSSNLKTLSPLMGSTEVALMGAATASLAKYYKMPFRAGGSLTDALSTNYQAGAETAYNIITPILSDIDVMQYACGSLGSVNMISFEKYILDEQNIKMAQRLKQGISIDMNKSYIDYIMEINHKGHFMIGPTPQEYFDEHFVADVFNKVDYNAWQMRDGKSLLENAKNTVASRIDNYQERTFDHSQMKVIEEYLMLESIK